MAKKKMKVKRKVGKKEAGRGKIIAEVIGFLQHAGKK